MEIQVPDLRFICGEYLGGRQSAYWASAFLFGDQDYPENSHHAGFDVESLASLLEQSGLKVISYQPAHTNFVMFAVKPLLETE